MKFLTEALETMKNGLAHSHAADYLSGSDKLKHIKDVNATARAEHNLTTQSKQEAAIKRGNRQSIVMYLGSELPKPLMNYIIETCQSLDHDLKIVSFESKAVTESLVGPYQQALEDNNIQFEKVRLSGSPMEELNSYLKSHPEIAFLACKENGFLGRIYLSGNPVKFKLPVPVVVVTADQPADVSIDKNEDNVKVINAA